MRTKLIMLLTVFVAVIIFCNAASAASVSTNHIAKVKLSNSVTNVDQFEPVGRW